MFDLCDGIYLKKIFTRKTKYNVIFVKLEEAIHATSRSVKSKKLIDDLFTKEPI
jgi:hypothetical protein